MWNGIKHRMRFDGLGDIPQPDRAIKTSAGQNSDVWRDAQRLDPIRMTTQPSGSVTDITQIPD